ncbi:hypothetical protein BpHYR1_033793 [Brachionus plicatilis]|uniref:Uncharacterized protein n=1 Tax=Brachionus plicatilis TaxID=10195 RepID=A0A3M7Q764_BRAPC|nr:hypothetical protein BpHYR1_033793 [Brachionus plicatilis]
MLFDYHLILNLDESSEVGKILLQVLKDFHLYILSLENSLLLRHQNQIIKYVTFNDLNKISLFQDIVLKYKFYGDYSPKKKIILQKLKLDHIS